MTTIQNRFGRTVRQQRRQRGWSQERLAEIAQLNRSFVGEIERGATLVSIITIEKIAHALQIPISEIFSTCETPQDDRVLAEKYRL